MLDFRTSLNEVQTNTKVIRIMAALIFIRARLFSFLVKVQRKLSSLIFITVATEYRLQKEAMMLSRKTLPERHSVSAIIESARENGQGNGDPARVRAVFLKKAEDGWIRTNICRPQKQHSGIGATIGRQESFAWRDCRYLSFF